MESSDLTSWVYNGLDCCVTLEIYDSLIPLLDPQTVATYELEKELQGPVLDMNMSGMLVDKQELMEAIGYMTGLINTYERNLNRLFTEGYGFEINWRSPQQLQTFLYDFLKLPPIRKRNAKGGYSRTADRDALERLSIYPIVSPVCEHMFALRDMAKKLGFLQTDIDTDGYIRSSYNIAGTTTGRLASAESAFETGSNLQNVDRLLRRILIAPAGKKICTIDLEQADSRNVGAMCWNKFLAEHGSAFAGSYLGACESGDLHTSVVRMGWRDLNWGDDERNFRAVADENAYRDYSYRDLAKKLGHGSNYYGQPPTMAKHSKLPVAVATDFQALYFEAFPCIPLGHKWVERELKAGRPLDTLFGRRRRFFGDPNDDKTLRDAIAFVGQGSTADEANRGLLMVWRQCKRFPGFQLIAQDHDSVSFYYDEETEDEIVPFALKCMEVHTYLAGDRPFYVPGEAKVGWNRGDYSDSPGKRLNLDGMKKWKNGDSRKRQVGPRAAYSLR
jgi:DNA polymerase I-like protein with 3'-5' exonuclease and polymerase domains